MAPGNAETDRPIVSLLDRAPLLSSDAVLLRIAQRFGDSGLVVGAGLLCSVARRPSRFRIKAQRAGDFPRLR
jgi:hypothetical protein